MRRKSVLFFMAALAVFFVLALGPRPPADETIDFDPARIGDDAGIYLAEREAAFPDIRDGAQKEIVWAGEPGQKTPYAVVYLHGFSATKMEIRPVPDRVAEELSANLYFARLSGHGRTGQAMAEASMNDWINDTAEAIAIGERIGDKVIIVGTSTGATLATWAAAQPELMTRVECLVLVSPNYAVRGVSTGLLNMPWGEYLLPLVMGQTRSFEPENEQHGRWWTTTYPSRAVFPMGALLKRVSLLNYENIAIPALFILSSRDSVVSPAQTKMVHDSWGGPKAIIDIDNSQDPNHHVIAGDILSPSTTEKVSQETVSWIRSLQ